MTSLDDLIDMKKPQLRSLWEKQFGKAPPPRLDVRLMRLALGWQIQAIGGKGLDPTTQRYLTSLKTQLLKSRGSDVGIELKRDSLSPGVSLVREWHGRIYCVQVVEQGFVWNDRVWNSLSAIAREITGARWNGPRFFGLRSRKIASQTLEELA